MSFTPYQASVPGFIRTLTNLSDILTKAEADSTTRKLDATALTHARLAPDMFPLYRQVQLLSDAAKGAGARLAGVENPSFSDTETTLPELKDRLAKTITFLKGLQPEQFQGAEDRPVTLKAGPRELSFSTGADYLSQFAIPQVYFHATTAYAILRHNGLNIGKMDYLGSF